MTPNAHRFSADALQQAADKARTDAKHIAEYLSDIESVLRTPEPEGDPDDYEGYYQHLLCGDVDIWSLIAEVTLLRDQEWMTTNAIESLVNKIQAQNNDDKNRLVQNGITFEFMKAFDNEANVILNAHKRQSRAWVKLRAELMAEAALDAADVLYQTQLPEKFERLLLNR